MHFSRFAVSQPEATMFKKTQKSTNATGASPQQEIQDAIVTFCGFPIGITIQLIISIKNVYVADSKTQF